MRRLLLVRHSTPVIVRERPAAEWRLSAEGASRARDLARVLDPGSASTVFSSIEPKATETARVLGQEWAIAVEEVPGLHEHERPDARIYTRPEFEALVRRLFEHPDERVFGVETAAQARLRFMRAVLRLIQQSREDVIVVTHGTVMTLFVSACTGRDPFTVWKQQQMPCAIALSLPELAFERLITLENQPPPA